MFGKHVAGLNKEAIKKFLTFRWKREAKEIRFFLIDRQEEF